MAKPDKTLYGEVDSKVLEELYNTFDTYHFLEAVDIIDKIRYRICEPDGMRQDLLRLHGMAMNVINGDHSQTRREDDLDIWELAEALDMEMYEFIEGLEKVSKVLSQLARLAPDPDWVDEEEETEGGG